MAAPLEKGDAFMQTGRRLRSLWPRTLRAQLGLLLVLFWLVPIVALSCYTILVYRQNVAASLRNTMDSRLYYAALLTNEKLSGVLSASRDISYDDTLETLNDDYLLLEQTQANMPNDTSDPAQSWQRRLYDAQQELKSSCTTYLNNQFALNSDFSLAVLVLDAQPNTPYFTERGQDNAYNYYATFIARKAERMSQSL